LDGIGWGDDDYMKQRASSVVVSGSVPYQTRLENVSWAVMPIGNRRTFWRKRGDVGMFSDSLFFRPIQTEATTEDTTEIVIRVRLLVPYWNMPLVSLQTHFLAGKRERVPVE
jgi:hypothetical protein